MYAVYFEILPIKDMGRNNISIKYRGCCFAASFTYFFDDFTLFYQQAFIMDLYITNSTHLVCSLAMSAQSAKYRFSS